MIAFKDAKITKYFCFYGIELFFYLNKFDRKKYGFIKA